MTSATTSSEALKLLQLGNGHLPHPWQDDAGQEVDRIPGAVAGEQSPEEGGHRHCRSPSDAALEAGGDGMNVLRQTQTVTGHAQPQMLHAARDGPHGLRACRLLQGLVDMPATW